MIWITGYVGSGKSTISKNIENCYEFDEIEELMKKEEINLNNINNKTFKPLCKKFLKTTNIKILNGIQAVDYYQKGDKVYFVKTNFIKSTYRSFKRDNKDRHIRNLLDNIILFFKLKILYIKVIKNNDLIKNI
jgi:deoxyadenosine/deoxycytidine kinase